MCPLGSLPQWQKENAHFICPPRLSFPGGCRCCGGHRAPGWGTLEMSRGTSKEGCSHRDNSAEEDETPPLSFLTLSCQSSFIAAPQPQKSHPAHHKSLCLLRTTFETSRPHSCFQDAVVPLISRSARSCIVFLGVGCIAAPCSFLSRVR